MSCIIVPLDGSAGFIGMGTWQSTSLTAKTAITADGPRSRHEETIAGFQGLERDGKILSWGVSNFDADDIEDAMGSQDWRARISPAIRFFITWRRSASLVCPVRSGGDGLQPLRPWQFSGS